MIEEVANLDKVLIVPRGQHILWLPLDSSVICTSQSRGAGTHLIQTSTSDVDSPGYFAAFHHSGVISLQEEGWRHHGSASSAKCIWCAHDPCWVQARASEMFFILPPARRPRSH